MKNFKNTKRLTALLLAAAMLCSCGAQEGGETQDTTVPESTQTDNGTQTSAEPLSNPVAVDADGNVDMTVALAYETDFDALLADLDAKGTTGDDTVSDNTNEKTQAVFDWLRENYGTNLITAQQMLNEKQTEDVLYYMETGDLPAIKGFDFIDVTVNEAGSRSMFTDMAIDWHQKSGGLVYFCWHWRVPAIVENADDPNSRFFYTEDIDNYCKINSGTKFSLKNAVTPGTKEYEIVIEDIDTVAIELQKLEAAGVPVLWRPLHEASGAWFWWGVADRETAEGEYYQKLWYMIYDRLENYHKLTNLIWVWNGQSKHAMVHPGTYDISGVDVYPTELDHSIQENKYTQLYNMTEEGKMLALTEVGYIPDPDELAASETVDWLFYMPWYGEFVYKGTNIYGIPKINEERLTSDFLKNLFSHENVITWSELPQWEGTTHEIPDSVTSQMLYINITLEEEAAQ